MIPDSESFLSIPSINIEGVQEYMWISPLQGFLVSTAPHSIDPFRAIGAACHYVETEPGLVEVKLAGSDKSITHALRNEEGILWWNIRGKEVPWSFVSVDAVPQWAHEVFARGTAKLKKDQETEQDETRNIH